MDAQKALALGWSVFPTSSTKQPLHGIKWGPFQQTRPSARSGRGEWRESAGKRGPATAVFVLTC